MLWNAYFLKGTKALIKMALAIFQLVSDLDGVADIYEFLKDQLLETLED